MLLAEGDEEPLIYNGEGREVLCPRALCRLADDREELILTQQDLLWVSGCRRADHKARAIDVHVVATEPAKGAERGTTERLGRAERIFFEGGATVLLLRGKLSHRKGSGRHSK